MSQRSTRRWPPPFARGIRRPSASRTAWLAGGLGLVASGSAWAGPVEELPVDSWLEVPNSHLRDVAHDWSPDSVPGNVSGVMAAWSGGAFDTSGQRLLVRGGGHGDYGGNEIYGADLDLVESAAGTNPWQKLSEPEAYGALDPDCENASNLTDNGLPRAQHSYGRLAYLPALNALCDTGGSIGYVYCPALRQLDCFDFDTNSWTMALTPAEAAGTASFGAVHPITGQWWLQGGSGSGLLGRYDPVQNEWSYGAYDNVPGSTAMSMSATIDTRRELFVAVGDGSVYMQPLATFEPGVTELTDAADGHDALVPTSGGDPIVSAAAPGIAYDPVLDRVVGWSGGADVYLLDVDSAVWTIRSAGGSAPSDAAANGTYGRFQYSAAYNVFVVVSSVDEPLYVLRLSESSGAGGTGAGGSAGGPSAGGAAGAAAGGSAAGGADVVLGPPGASSDEGGCSCTTPDRHRGGLGSLWLAALAIGAAIDRRARRPGHPMRARWPRCEGSSFGLPPSRLVLRCALSVLGFVAVLSSSTRARSDEVVVDRVVAVVDRAPILLSTLRARAGRAIEAMQGRVEEQGQRLVEAATIYRDTLARLVEERLLARFAAEQGIEVTEAEVEAALAHIARSSGLTRSELEREVRKAGMTAEDYRAEIGRQVLEARAMQRSADLQQLRVTEEELRHAYQERARAQAEHSPGTEPSFEQLRDTLYQQVYQRKLTKVREALLSRLRAECFVELRLKH